MNYIVQRGDTLTSIAARFNVTVQAILAANPLITNPNLIFVGQVIRIPTVQPPPPPPPPTGGRYVVQPGDTLAAIARRFNVRLPALIAANPQIANPNLIFPGQIINIPGR